MNEEQKQWLRDNLRINVRYVRPYDSDPSVYIGLYFVDDTIDRWTEQVCFSEELISIPDGEV